VVTGATTLTPSLRRLIQRTLNSVVFDCYETQELGLVAWECPHTGLFHVCDDSVILEILNNGVPAGDGEEGEIFATSLHLKTMPFIRLKVGDLVRKGPDPCPCGVPFSTLESIQGRTEDFLLLPGKREVQASTIFSIIHEHAPWVIQYELEQIHEREVILRIVPHHHGDVCLEELRGRIIKTLGQDVVLKIEVLDEIEPDPERKYKVFKSRLRPYIGFDSSRS
jgi:phenylacetate-CoA ligase